MNPLKAALPNAHVRDELKNADQVRKERKLEERKKEHLQRVRPRGVRGGGAFPRGQGGRPAWKRGWILAAWRRGLLCVFGEAGCPG